MLKLTQTVAHYEEAEFTIMKAINYKRKRFYSTGPMGGDGESVPGVNTLKLS